MKATTGLFTWLPAGSVGSLVLPVNSAGRGNGNLVPGHT